MKYEVNTYENDARETLRQFSYVEQSRMKRRAKIVARLQFLFYLLLTVGSVILGIIAYEPPCQGYWGPNPEYINQYETPDVSPSTRINCTCGECNE